MPRLPKESIYPTPKSYDEQRRKRAEINKIRASHAPKHIFLSSSLKIYGILIGIFLITKAMPVIFAGNIISGVFLSFLMGLILFGYAAWAMASISNLFQNFGHRASPLFLLYTCIYPAAAVALFTFTAHFPLLVFFILATCLHFILMYVLTKVALRQSRDSA